MTRWPPPTVLSKEFFKGHGLGNDYLVFEEGEEMALRWVEHCPASVIATEESGVTGSWWSSGGGGRPRRRVRLRMFNPDGGEFERSGNGLRVFAAWWALRRPEEKEVAVRVGGDVVALTIGERTPEGLEVSAAMGRAAVGLGAVGGEPDPGPGEEQPGLYTLLDGPEGGAYDVVPVRIGNPHVVIPVSAGDLNRDTLLKIGPWMAKHPRLKDGANVQIVAARPPDEADILIWERGVGVTSASGTSSCAVAAAMVSVGRLDPGWIRISMPGGELRIHVDTELDVTLQGPVQEVMEGELSDDLLSRITSGRG